MSSLHKTRGIALRVSDYSETSAIARIYTEDFGMQSYMLNGVKRKKSSIKSTMLQPLTLLHLNVYHKSNSGLQRASEIRNEPVLHTIAFDMRKTSVAFMISEIISRTVKESEANKKLFGFLFDAVLQLDTQPSADAFQLSFLLHLSSHLGFFPSENFSDATPCFNLKDGVFQQKPPSHLHFLNIPLSNFFFSLTKTPLENCNVLQFSPGDKRNLLSALVTYYRLHQEGFTGIRSQQILEDIWTIQ